MNAAAWRGCLVVLLAAFTPGAIFAQVTVGEAAPDFRLQDQKGAWHTLAQHRGRWIALYFYPKDQTPGCTKEACAFRDNIFAFDELGAVILGVSLDDVASHAEFAEKYSLPFPLLADTGGVVAKRYNVLNVIGPMKLAKRETFLIAPDGTVAKHYRNVNAETHSEEVLTDLRELKAREQS